ncbi:hypothetical protein C2W62_46595 [Candidatus Entotheonella serta]|nr:hypothetical protein C2W62_46595 [Candidatus Entotheonella serta]
MAKAAKAAGYTRSRVYAWREQDATWRERWDDAIAEYAETLEAEADRRAKEGVSKPLFYQGHQCGTVQEYSNVLLMFRLKALRPDLYRERAVTVQLPAQAARTSDPDT